MCDKRVFKRFNKIYDFIKKDCRFTIDGNHAIRLYKIFKTKMGERKVTMSNIDNNRAFSLEYFDYDDTLLFSLLVNKKGEMTIFQANIDEIAIFSAIYELECIIYNKKVKSREGFLEHMLSYYNPLGKNWFWFNWS